jgi:phosphoribosylformylglycinamidine synthase
MGEACRVLGTPVTGGNVSFYNENPGGAVYPSPDIGMVGLAEDAEKTIGMTFTNDGYAIYLLGSEKVSWSGSEWQVMQHDEPRGELPDLDLQLESRLQDLIVKAIQVGYVSAAHDLAEGGLVVALAEMAVADENNQRGALVELEEPTALSLFGEGPSRAIVTVKPENIEGFEELAEKLDVPAEWIGNTGGKGIGFRGLFKVMLEELHDAYHNSLERELGTV